MLKKASLATIIYYDILGYPLTEFEVWKHLIQPSEAVERVVPTLGEVSASVVVLVAEGRVARFRGFVFLPGKESLVLGRIQAEKRAVKKIRRAARLAHYLAWVPFVRMIGLTGSLSMKQGDQESDWDFFVVLQKGAIWRGRTVLSAVLQLLGKRRHGSHIENRACLNHFVTDGSLQISLQDFFSAHEYRFMYPLIGGDTFRCFELANHWMIDIKPTYRLTELAPLWLHQTHPFVLRARRIGEMCLQASFWEPFLATWQKKKIEANPKTHMLGAFIIVNDEALIFLPRPKGPAIFERFKQLLSAS